MKNLSLVLLFIMVIIKVAAQQNPQYIMAPVSSHNIKSGGGANPVPLSGVAAYRHFQILYYPFEFPNMPKGYITRIYFMAGYRPSNLQPCNTSYPHSFIGMRHHTSGEGHDSLNLPFDIMQNPIAQWYVTDTVFYSAQHTSTTAWDSGDWVGYTLQKQFLYDPARTLMLDISSLSESPMFTCETRHNFNQVINYQMPNPYVRLYTGAAPGSTVPQVSSASTGGTMPYIAFDLQPLSGVAGVNKAQLAVYPNPATDKLYVVKAKSKSYVVTDIAGKILQQGMLHNNSIDLSMLLPGLYLLKMDNQVVKFLKE